MKTHVSLLCALVCALCLLLAAADGASAHRVNIFAWVAGGAIETESAFSSGGPARSSRVSVLDAASGSPLAEGVTDSQGRLRIAITEAMLAAPKGVILRLDAGEGHQASWPVEASELAMSGSQEPMDEVRREFAEDSEEARRTSTAVTPEIGQQGDDDVIITDAELKAVVKAALEEEMSRQLEPMRRELAMLRNPEPGLREIAGGIGWLVGLAGMAAFAMSRRRPARGRNEEEES
ncbi:MAG: hypothetical protein Q4F72_10110 [Desulfovibrionaceae bacterium]|nr:hypothetical protein [Desulfovibrionaceae bacterium]